MKEITSAEFQAEVLRSEAPVLVDFFTAQCGPCRAMMPVLEEIERESEGALRLVKVDATNDAAFTASHRVTAVPTFLFFYHGRCLARTTGSISKKSMKQWIEDALKNERAI